jgi:hypothetical protein
MAIESPIDLEALSNEVTNVSLVVVWKRGRSVDGGEIRIADDVAQHLQSACRATVERVQHRDLRRYSADMHLEQEECLVVSDDALIAESPLAEYIVPTAPLKLINARALPRQPFWLYAATLQTADGPVAFVRKTNPRQAARPGRIHALLGNTLSRVRRAVFTLDDFFDLIVSEQGVLALDQRTFELLFRETPELQARIPEWISAINQHLPFTGNGGQLLAARATTDGRLRRRLRAIAERGHLESVTIDRIRRHLREAGLPEEDFIEKDKLVVDESDPFRLVYMLNEDFFSGGLTDVAFRSDRKSPR